MSQTHTYRVAVSDRAAHVPGDNPSAVLLESAPCAHCPGDPDTEPDGAAPRPPPSAGCGQFPGQTKTQANRDAVTFLFCWAGAVSEEGSGSETS